MAFPSQWEDDTDRVFVQQGIQLRKGKRSLGVFSSFPENVGRKIRTIRLNAAASFTYSMANMIL